MKKVIVSTIGGCAANLARDSGEVNVRVIDLYYTYKGNHSGRT